MSRLRHIDIPHVHGWLVPVAVEAKPKKGETAVAAIERVRGALHRARGELAAVRAAPLLRELLLRMARTAVNDLALGGQPAVTTAGGKFAIQWDRVSVPGYPAASDNYVPRLLAALFPDHVHALLTGQIPDLPGIGAAERAERERELEAEILRLEHEEESLITHARAKGLDVARRRDVSAYALLGCDPGHLHVPQAVAAE